MSYTTKTNVSENTPTQQELSQISLRNRVLEASFTFSNAVSSELELEHLCDLVVEQIVDIFAPNTAALLFLDEDTGRLYKKRSFSKKDSPDTGLSEIEDNSVANRALRRKKVICTRPDPNSNKDTGEIPRQDRISIVAMPFTLDEEEAQSRDLSHSGEAAAPLMAERRVKGVVTMTWPKESLRPSDEDLHMLDVLAGHVATAIDNAWLYKEITSFNQKLETKVDERTAELAATNSQLRNALNELKQTQSQLIEQEKMACLGQLTAGIAHEINNPLAYSLANIALVEDRLLAVDTALEILSCRLSLCNAPSDASKLQEAKAFVTKIEQHPRYKTDVSSLRAEVQPLPPSEQITLLRQFVGYIDASEETQSPRENLVKGVRKLMHKSHEGLSRVKSIILDLRSFSRLDKAHFQTVDVDDGIARTLSIVSHMAKDRQVTIVHNRGLSSPYACFPAKLNQVILNLVTNALQASEPQGHITVWSQETQEGPAIAVEDNGSGIPAQHLTKIFDPFFTNKPVGQGTGLGLSISYKIIQEHGGTIKVTSKPGLGTKFTIQLPPRPGTKEI